MWRSKSIKIVKLVVYGGAHDYDYVGRVALDFNIPYAKKWHSLHSTNHLHQFSIPEFYLLYIKNLIQY